jgi:hypothetical protein
MNNSILRITSEMSFSFAPETATVLCICTTPSAAYNHKEMERWTASQWVNLIDSDPTYFFYVLMKHPSIFDRAVDMNVVLLGHAIKLIKYISSKPELDCLYDAIDTNTALWHAKGYRSTIQSILDEIKSVKKSFGSETYRDSYPLSRGSGVRKSANPPPPRFSGGHFEDEYPDEFKGTFDKRDGYDSRSRSGFRGPTEEVGGFGKGPHVPSRTPSLSSSATRTTSASSKVEEGLEGSIYGDSRNVGLRDGRTSSASQKLTPAERLDSILGSNGATDKAIRSGELTREVRDKIIELFERSDSYWDPQERVFKFSMSRLIILMTRYPENLTLEVLLRYCDVNYVDVEYEDWSNSMLEGCLRSGRQTEIYDCVNTMFIGVRQVSFEARNENALGRKYGRNFSSMQAFIEVINKFSSNIATGFRR